MAFPQIFPLEVPDMLQPPVEERPYPPYSDGYGVEQDAYAVIKRLATEQAVTLATADYHYLPVYWTRYHIMNGYGSQGIQQLQTSVNKLILDPTKTFTVCQYDDGPIVDLQGSKVFLASRKSSNGLDAPLLANYPTQNMLFRRKFKASLVGNLQTHEIREPISEFLRSQPKTFTSGRFMEPREYFRIMKSSLITVAPRGYGGSSFRFYEAIHHGSVPWLIGEIDTRPFPTHLPWADATFFSSNVEDFKRDYVLVSLQDIIRRRKVIAERIAPQLRFGTWVKLMVESLHA